MIHGVGRDSERIVKVIERRLRAATPDLEEIQAEAATAI